MQFLEQQSLNSYLSDAAEQIQKAEESLNQRILSARDYKMADYSYEVIMEYIREFEATLDENHEVAVMLASFGQNITMTVTKIGYANPSTLVFYGYVQNQPATLIQHLSQLNFLLLAAEKIDPEKPPHRIVGFASSGTGEWRDD